MTRKRLLVGALSLILAAPAWAQASHPCKFSLAQGFIEMRRARFASALEQFDRALAGTEECVVEAHLGKASTHNAMNDHKPALAEAARVLRSTDDPELLSEAHYQIGLARHQRGNRMTPKKAEAEAAFQRAVELSRGEHRGAIRALSRLYQETARARDLAALEERFPHIRVRSRAERLRSGGGPKERGAAVPGCDTHVRTGWDQDLPHFLADDDPEAEGFVAPRLTAGAEAQYSAAARKARIQGRLEVEALIDDQGKVIQVRVLEDLHPDLDDAARDAACRFAFEPARTPGGEPTACYIRGKFDFKL